MNQFAITFVFTSTLIAMSSQAMDHSQHAAAAAQHDHGAHTNHNSKMAKSSAAAPSTATQFGAPITLKEALTLDQAIAQLKDPNATQKNILIEAKVDSVCEMKGCWMGLKTGTNTARVTFKDYKYFVPVSLRGQMVKVEGTLEETKMSLKETKHYVKDAGGNPDEVKEPKTEYRIVATGVEVVK